MIVKILRPFNAELLPIYRCVGVAVASRFSSIVLDKQGVAVVVPDWSAFLSAVWSAYSECSKTNVGVLLSVPLRVRLLDFGAETRVSYDTRCAGIRYTSLVRYGTAE